MYTQLLLRDLTKADLEVHKMLRDVALAVFELSKGKQRPVCDHIISKLYNQFLFSNPVFNYAKHESVAAPLASLSVSRFVFFCLLNTIAHPDTA